MPENEPHVVSAMITITIDGVPRTFVSTVTATLGQEGLMLDMCWRQTRAQVAEALNESKK